MKYSPLPLPSPLQLGYRMPAEWEPHAGTWFTWPRREGISFPNKYDTVPQIYSQLINALLRQERVHINVWNSEMEEEVKRLLASFKVSTGQLHFHPFPAYEPWCRDHGPIFLVRDREGNHERAVVDWAYNAWGNKYPPYDLDDAVPARVAEHLGLPLFSPGMVLEGGAIDVNGAGTLLTTEACLLHPNRNPHLSRAQIETCLREYLGVTKILWLGEGIVGDDTDGHVDDLARFVGPRTVVTVMEADPADANYAILKENRARLATMTDQSNQPLRIIELPMPGIVEHQGQRLPASYANFYIANGQVLVPTYRHKHDALAIQILQELFPKREVKGIDSTELIWGLGSFHCITQQEPA